MPADPVPGLLSRATELLEEQFAALPAFESAADPAAMAPILEEVALRLGDNYPYFHPLYAGQMLKPPHPLARAAYALAMTINPNNHARDGGRASSEMEIEAVREIAAIFGWKDFLGHLTSSGTLANLEALWVAGQLGSGKRIVGSEQAHYTHQRISAVLKLEYAPIAADHRGRMSLPALEDELRKGDVGTVVVTLGTTAIGAVDPLDEILALRERYGFRVHVDAAYGGYFRLIPEALDLPARRALRGHRPGRFDRDRPAQARLAALRLRLRALPRPIGGALLQARLALTPTSRRSSCTWARSAWSARGPEPRRWLCGPRRSSCRSVPGGEFARGLARGRAAAVELDRRLREDQRRALPGACRRRPGAGYCGLEDEGRDARASLGAGAKNLCGLRPSGFASGSCRIAAEMVSARGGF
jgi:tyrosine decarboxylase/aspartate 1-decarboxylase